MTTDLIEKPTDVAAAPLVTMEPEKYVAAVFVGFIKQVEAYKVRAASATYDVTTTAGMKLVTELRAEGRAIRVASEKARKERKAPILEIGKLLDSRQKDIEAQIEPLESKFDGDIKAEEARKEAIRMEKLNAEIKRSTAIRERIAMIQRWPADAVGQTAAHIQDEIEQLEKLSVDATFDEFVAEAAETKDAALTKLRAMHLAAAQKETADAAAEQERQAVAQRQRDEDARLQREREALAEQRAADEQRRQEEDARAAAERKAADDAAEQERAKAAQALEAQRRELAEQAAALAEKQRVADAAEQQRRDEATAAQREQDRKAAEEAAAQAEADRKAADAAHKASVHVDIIRELVAHEFPEECAAQLIELISVDAIPHLTINY